MTRRGISTYPQLPRSSYVQLGSSHREREYRYGVRHLAGSYSLRAQMLKSRFPCGLRSWFVA